MLKTENDVREKEGIFYLYSFYIYYFEHFLIKTFIFQITTQPVSINITNYQVKHI